MDFWRRAGHREDDEVGGLGGGVGLGGAEPGGMTAVQLQGRPGYSPAFQLVRSAAEQ